MEPAGSSNQMKENEDGDSIEVMRGAPVSASRIKGIEGKVEGNTKNSSFILGHSSANIDDYFNGISPLEKPKKSKLGLKTKRKIPFKLGILSSAKTSHPKRSDVVPANGPHAVFAKHSFVLKTPTAMASVAEERLSPSCAEVQTNEVQVGQAVTQKENKSESVVTTENLHTTNTSQETQPSNDKKETNMPESGTVDLINDHIKVYHKEYC